MEPGDGALGAHPIKNLKIRNILISQFLLLLSLENLIEPHL